MKSLKLLLLLFFLTNVKLYSQATVFYTQDFENASNPSGLDWTFSQGTTVSNNNNYWVWGTGTAGATTGAACYTGTGSLQVWRRSGGGWSANYGNYTGQNRTVSKTFNFSTIPTGSTITLTYWLLTNGELITPTYYDYFQMEINSTLVFGPSVGVTSWTQKTFDLSAYAGNPSVTVTFRWINDGSFNYPPGTRIDDFKIDYLPPVALPVELLYFKGTPFSTYNKLYWATATEFNSDYFQIDESLDGVSWNEICKMQAAGNSQTLLNYSYYREIKEYGTHYYRLKQVDFNGAYKYYDIIAINNESLKEKIVLRYYNMMGQEININEHTGPYIVVYEDGSSKKMIKNE